MPNVYVLFPTSFATLILMALWYKSISTICTSNVPGVVVVVRLYSFQNARGRQAE